MLLSHTAQISTVTYAAGQVASLLKDRLSDRKLAYKSTVLAYLTFITVLSLKSQLDVRQKGRCLVPVADLDFEDQSTSTVLATRKRSSTWAVSEPTRSWFNAAAIIGRARSVSAPSSPRRCTSFDDVDVIDAVSVCE